ncbi:MULTISPECIES: hypothetical protein [unclassified Providencia]|uniref:hypothetical protein n=1 Tax=unclassified Providencia TaxID=2633465 RepID=UPI00234961A0|nr:MULTISPECIES: hypothetical protein [unclassified Providencia]
MTSLADKVRKAADRLRNLNKNELINMLDNAGIVYEEIDSAGVVSIENVKVEGRCLSPQMRIYGTLVGPAHKNNETDLRHYQRISLEDNSNIELCAIRAMYEYLINPLSEKVNAHDNEEIFSVHSYITAAMPPEYRSGALALSDFNSAEHDQDCISWENTFLHPERENMRTILINHGTTFFNYTTSSDDREDKSGILTH